MAAWVGAALGLAAALSLQATVLDSFSGSTQTGWTDTPNGGHFTQGGGQLAVTTAASATAVTYGQKTSSSFATASGQTLEFRVDVDAVTPPFTNTSIIPAAILAWMPSGAAPGTGSSGYSLSVSPGVVTMQKGSAVLFSTNYITAGTNIQNTNITLVVRLTPSGGTMTFNARVYLQTGHQPDQVFTELFEYTATPADSAGASGYATLAVSSGGSPSGATVDFDNLQVFVLNDTVLDNFSTGAADAANYTILLNGGTATIASDSLELKTPTYNNTIFTGAIRNAPSYEITDGGRIELSVDVLNNATGPADPYATAVLGFAPCLSSTCVQELVAYHIGAGCFALYMGKGYGEWWVNAQEYPEYVNTSIPVPSENPGKNLRLIMSMTGEGLNCRVDSRVEDLNVGVNNPNRVLYQSVYLDEDTPGVYFDTSTTPHYPDGANTFPQAYTNLPGNIVLYSFFGGNSTDDSDITFANLVVNQTTPVSLPPSVVNVAPPIGSNFVAHTTPVTFNVLDSVNTPVANISLTLNGVTYANGSGATVSGTSQNRLFTLTTSLAPDTFYSGTLAATNGAGLVNLQPYSIDTFTTNDCYTVESEDWNYNGGQFIEPYNNLVNAYYQIVPVGVSGIDFNDHEGSPDTSDEIYRSEPPRTYLTSDGPRAKYILNPPPAGQPSEVVVIDRQAGDWMDYTHAYPAGYWTAYMRMSQYLLPQSLITLEQVTSDPTQPNQTTVVLGSFMSTPSGYDVTRDVPLTDAFGNPVVVYFNGQTNTLRINNQIVNASETELWQNYFVFAPAATPGSLPPFVATVTPLAGAVLNVGAVNPTVSIVNRTTTLNTGSVIVLLNGAPVSATVTPTPNGATVTWLPAATTPIVTNTLIFEDSASVWQTNSWTYTYSVVLKATGALPLGSLSVPGVDARLILSSEAAIDSGGLPNTLPTAETVMGYEATNSVNVDFTSTNWVQNVDWGLSGNENGALTTNFPGLCLGPNVSFAVEAFAYVQLNAGLNRFYINSDDVTGIFIGTNLTDLSTLVIDTTPINTANTTFDFLAPVAGLYPFHLFYEQGGGGAHCLLESVNVATGAQTVLNTAGGASIYYPLIVRSAPSAAGPWGADAAANAGNVMGTLPVYCQEYGSQLDVAVNGGTITFPLPNQTKFYVLDGPRASQITGFTQSGANLVITYQYQ